MDMTTLKRLTPALLVLACSGWLLSACSSTQVIKSNSTPAISATDVMPDNLYLDIAILPLEPGIPVSEEEQDKQLIIPDVRRAESRYIAYQLKDTLELTGNWGAVRVMPTMSEAVDLQISGEILESNGETLKARITATDATGKQWVSKVFEDNASKYSYRASMEDPFQDFYNDIANALLLERQKLKKTQLTNLRQVTRLKYANGLAPDAFGGYLTEKRGRTSITQLPAQNDTMLNRVEQIKVREDLFVDTLDDYYGNFYREMKPSYNEWRLATYDESLKLKEMKAKAYKAGAIGVLSVVGGIYGASQSNTWAGQAAGVAAVGGGIMAGKVALDRYQEAEIHAQSLRELSQSLGAEITPHVLSIEGRTIELTGTADVQYQEWRRILKDIYAEETGLPVK
ncbi:MAG: hypothetical protein ACI9SB_002847 [Candidatus Azotimanducaceae bacterium]|jgi:hypothetical protein